MKLIIDISEEYYSACKSWDKDNVAMVEQSIIAHGTPYEERLHGTCKTCKHFVKGGLDGKTYVCEHPNIEREDYYDYACLMVEENDFCSSYEARKEEGE